MFDEDALPFEAFSITGISISIEFSSRECATSTTRGWVFILTFFCRK
jgi:hypothetical protein